MTTGFVYDRRFLDHDTGAGHPERPARLTATLKHLDKQAWRQQLTAVEPISAPEKWLRTIHSREYISRAESACKAGHPFLDSMDVAISEASFAVAKLAAGGPLCLADKILNDELSNGFALVRPPGHHAENDAALGFCLFNNVAITARYLQQHHGIDKVAIVDWDVHHGNGTQHSFYEDPSVMYVSTHQYPYYPGTGAASEIGDGRGAHSTVNCPMPAGAGDQQYILAFNEIIIPALNRFKPEALIISAGFDAHVHDPLAEISLSTSFFSWMTLRLMEVADQHANGRIVSVLEGGYNTDTLGDCVAAHLACLLGMET